MRYKGSEAGQDTLRDPLAEVDQRVEKIVRLRLDERFPEHDIIGGSMTNGPAETTTLSGPSIRLTARAISLTDLPCSRPPLALFTRESPLSA